MPTRIHLGGLHEEPWRRPDLTVTIEPPPGYARVWGGLLEPGDLCLVCNEPGLPGVTRWRPVKIPAEKDVRQDQPYSRVKWFGCVIRRGEQDYGRACVRCEAYGRDGKTKYCVHCLCAPDAMTWSPPRPQPVE